MSKLFFADLEGLCISHGFVFERCSSATGKYELFSNEHAPGTTGVYETLEEAWQDISSLQQDMNPLTGAPLNGFVEPEPEECVVCGHQGDCNEDGFCSYCGDQ